VALVIGIAGTVYGSLGVGFAAQNAINTVWNIPHVHWPSRCGPAKWPWARQEITASFTEAAGEDPLAGRQ